MRTLIAMLLMVSAAHAAEKTQWIEAPSQDAHHDQPLVEQATKCWNVPVGVENAKSAAVDLVVVTKDDGSVKKVGIVHPSKNKLTKSINDSAVQAVFACAPYTNVTGGEHKITMNPSDMF